MVTLINCFEVPEAADQRFMDLYAQVNAYMRSKPGYAGNRLHKATSEHAAYRYVNVAQWQSAEHCAAAHDDGFRNLVAKDEWKEFRSVPALFEVISENQA